MAIIRSAALNTLIVAVSIVACFAALEAFLWAWSATHVVERKEPVVPPAEIGDEIVVPADVVEQATRRQQILTMPESWKRRPAEVPGAALAMYWHDVLHVYNSEGMRWSTPYPPKRSDTFRVMVVGDSLTWGDGLDIEWRFSNLLERSMGRTFKIEFINLGHDGYQSEDIRNVVRQHLPTIKPDLVLFGICLNDFLPSGQGEYADLSAYALPLPDALKTFFAQRTRAGAFLTDMYDRALRTLHLRMDFYDDVLADFGGYRTRFAQDVKDMNALVTAAGLPPMLAMVLHQYPSYDGRGHRIARVAEKALLDANAIVIPTENYYRRYNNQRMFISQWEGHPNEVANFIWAGMIAKELQGRQDLQAFKRVTDAPAR